MTKAELKKSHDAMARFLKSLCEFSDKECGANRNPDTERRYKKARRLLRNAGVNYDPLTGDHSRT